MRNPPTVTSRRRTAVRRAVLAASAAAGLAVLAGLPAGCPPPPEDEGPVFRNTTDPTNGGAGYVGAAACDACHADYAALNALHGHNFTLNPIAGAPPTYPPQAARAGVPDPPPQMSWSDVRFVIDGYLRAARFVDTNGFVMTTGTTGVPTQYNLDFPPNGTQAGFVPYLPDQAALLPLTFEVFGRLTTGAQPQDPENPLSQENRPGIQGTWAQAGVRCEACHGPGSFHVPNPQTRNIFVNSTVIGCQDCHLAGDDPNVILAADGFVNPHTQVAELRGSGGHADFDCTFCHDPHASTIYDRTLGIRNECLVCHGDQNRAFHAAAVFQRGDYSEPLGCESCHMPYAGRQFHSAGPDAAGTQGGRIGDVRSHIFRVDPELLDVSQMLTPDGTRVATDAAGQAGLSLDFVCLRCHNGTGNAFQLTTLGAQALARNMHANAAAAGEP